MTALLFIFSNGHLSTAESLLYIRLLYLPEECTGWVMKLQSVCMKTPICITFYCPHRKCSCLLHYLDNLMASVSVPYLIVLLVRIKFALYLSMESCTFITIILLCYRYKMHLAGHAQWPPEKVHKLYKSNQDLALKSSNHQETSMSYWLWCFSSGSLDELLISSSCSKCSRHKSLQMIDTNRVTSPQ